MTKFLIDAHIHLDKYSKDEVTTITNTIPSSHIEAIISVSINLQSSKANLALSGQFPQLIYAACGYHPEQILPNEADQRELLMWLEDHIDDMVAIGEIGLPYYTKLEAIKRGVQFDLEPYVIWLEQLLQVAAKHNKPVVLHAVYEDADLVCDLLQKYNITKAHFHWFKGSSATLQRMARCGYYISFTPDILYETEIQTIAKHYPMNLVMVETDGPWPFEGPFTNQMTHPAMIHESTSFYARLCNVPLEQVYRQFTHNTKQFYRL